MGQPKTQLILAAPVIINDTTRQLPSLVVNLPPTLKHLKKCNYVDKPVGPNVSIELGGSIFSMRHLLAHGIDLVGPNCPPLHVQSSPDSSRLFSMFTTADSERTKAQEKIRPPKEVPY